MEILASEWNSRHPLMRNRFWLTFPDFIEDVDGPLLIYTNKVTHSFHRQEFQQIDDATMRKLKRCNYVDRIFVICEKANRTKNY